ncbi:MAG: DUF1850 domain-containing protein [Nitratireductor sp.]
MSLAACIIVGGKQVIVAGALFTLSWTHSVEKTEWREVWKMEGSQLLLIEARVRGSGAGMDPGEGARLEDGWWVWKPQNPPVEALNLAASGATISGWQLCSGGQCMELGIEADNNIRIEPCRKQ